MDWKEYYSSRLTTAEEAVKLIKSNDKVVLAHDVGEPPVLVDAMVANHAAYKNVEISHMFTLGKGEYCKPNTRKTFTLISGSSADRQESALKKDTVISLRYSSMKFRVS